MAAWLDPQEAALPLSFRPWAAIALSLFALSACRDEEPERPTSGDGGFQKQDGGRLPPPCTGQSHARCEGECVNLQADLRHCGGCDQPCAEGAVCSAGQCQCPSGRTGCGEVCADLGSDARHCGSCGSACALGSACIGGTCVLQCQGGGTRCGASCADLSSDPEHCGGCDKACSGGRVCVESGCRCPSGEISCGASCANLQSDSGNCGSCGTQCFSGYQCQEGKCTCPATYTSCGVACVDLSSDPTNCGGCNVHCMPGQTCKGSFCDSPCPLGLTKCGNLCVDLSKSASHCGGCNTPCGLLSCLGGQCQACDSATTDCDGDGWKVADGDCCDQPGPACGSEPALVNPGAVELMGNGIDDNCNGLVDAADYLDLGHCDSGLLSNSADPVDYARAMGICRTTTDQPPLSQRTWGLLSARLLRADGSALTFAGARSIRENFGNVLGPAEGRSMVLLSSGVAADGSQTNPGPNGGPNDTSVPHPSPGVNIQTCTLPHCIADWFGTANPPLKSANRLPEAPGCSGGWGGQEANDSAMLVLTLRAPTNARSFQLKAYFFSAEYPEFVCSTYNDQLVVLVNTPGGEPPGHPNPVDKNLMTYSHNGQHWPVGINVAKGTPLFRVCETQAQNPTCWESNVSPQSCGLGPQELLGTGFEWNPGWGGPPCLNGGGTGWLVTAGNVRPGELVELRIAIWDVGDQILDSLALVDAFEWLPNPVVPGTTD